jgi:hypothetical protein
MRVTKPLTDDEVRAEFEAWAKLDGGFTLRREDDLDYGDPFTNAAWHAWQAATVAGVKHGMERDHDDAERYRCLRAGNYPIEFARSVLNDTPQGIDAAVDAIRREIPK